MPFTPDLMRIRAVAPPPATAPVEGDFLAFYLNGTTLECWIYNAGPANQISYSSTLGSITVPFTPSTSMVGGYSVANSGLAVSHKSALMHSDPLGVAAGPLFAWVESSIEKLVIWDIVGGSLIQHDEHEGVGATDGAICAPGDGYIYHYAARSGYRKTRRVDGAGSLSTFYDHFANSNVLHAMTIDRLVVSNGGASLRYVFYDGADDATEAVAFINPPGDMGDLYDGAEVVVAGEEKRNCAQRWYTDELPDPQLRRAVIDDNLPSTWSQNKADSGAGIPSNRSWCIGRNVDADVVSIHDFATNSIGFFDGLTFSSSPIQWTVNSNGGNFPHGVHPNKVTAAAIGY